MPKKPAKAPRKTKVNNIASVGIIYRKTNPSEIFIEKKDAGYPIKLFRNCLCPIGGNWIGKEAKQDKNPLETFRREIAEELNPINPTASNFELRLLGIESKSKERRIHRHRNAITPHDKKILTKIKNAIEKSARPFGDFILSTPKKYLDQADSKNKLIDLTCLVSYWLVPLDEKSWNNLSFLQKKYANLSSESHSQITSLENIVKTKQFIGFGHDQVFKKFFLDQKINLARKMKIIKGPRAQKIGSPKSSYLKYLANFEISKKPILE